MKKLSSVVTCVVSFKLQKIFKSTIITRVGPIYEKFSDQALNWSKVVPWHEKQSEAIIFQLS